MTWTQNDLYSSSSFGLSEQTFGTFKFRTAGGFRGRSAYASGTAAGNALSNAPGLIGDTRGLTVVRSVVPAI